MNQIMENMSKQYLPVLKEVFDDTVEQPTPPKQPGFFAKLFGAKPIPISEPVKTTKRFERPQYVVFITDGQAEDYGRLAKFHKKHEEDDVFVQYIGLGRTNFEVIKKLGDNFKNLAYCPLSDLSDENIHESLITQKFSDWLASRT